MPILLFTVSFGSLMNIDKLILVTPSPHNTHGFGSLMNIDKLIHTSMTILRKNGFGSLMNIDKLIPYGYDINVSNVLVL